MPKYKIIILVVLGLVMAFLIYNRIAADKTIAFTPNISPTNEIGLNIGDTAPELSFENPQGKIIALSSLRGKLVLIDFWAGWCGPCRLEKPNIVKAYKKFGNKEFINGRGFTVYGLSLDKSKEQWLYVIEADSLIWPYHVSDLQGWNSAGAELYQIRSIPASFLIDGNGVIIGRNLKGESLHSALESILK